MPQNKRYILSTRPLDGSLAAADGEGIVIDEISFIQTQPLRDPALVEKILALSGQALTVVFTSMNAVTAVTEAVGAGTAAGGAIAVGIAAAGMADPGAIAAGTAGSSWRIYCIGAATKELVVSSYGADHIAGTASSASALADIIIAEGPAEVYFFCGDQRREELPQRLRQKDIGVHEIVVYSTRPTPRLLERDYDAIAFFSPSAVHSLFSINTVPQGTILFAIGETTASAIREYSTNPVICSGSPDKYGLIRLAIDHFKQ